MENRKSDGIKQNTLKNRGRDVVRFFYYVPN